MIYKGMKAIVGKMLQCLENKSDPGMGPLLQWLANPA